MAIKVGSIIKELNGLAPEYLAEDWDNIGLQVGSNNSKVSRILLALDATERVIDEAIKIKADMIVTHHPLIFKAVTNILKETPQGGKLYKLIKHNMNLYVMHTNFDAALGGTNDVLANKIGMYNINPIKPDANGMGIGRIGNIKEIKVKELLGVLKEKLNLSHVRLVGDLEKKVETIAICTGSGMGFLQDTIGKADVFITGDIKFHQAQEALEQGIILIDVGHYGSENIAMASIQQYMEPFAIKNNLEIVISKINEDPFTTI